jgi:hypothetical protein
MPTLFMGADGYHSFWVPLYQKGYPVTLSSAVHFSTGRFQMIATVFDKNVDRFQMKSVIAFA